jgi:hypothetical protein
MTRTCISTTTRARSLNMANPLIQISQYRVYIPFLSYPVHIHTSQISPARRYVSYPFRQKKKKKNHRIVSIRVINHNPSLGMYPSLLPTNQFHPPRKPLWPLPPALVAVISRCRSRLLGDAREARLARVPLQRAKHVIQRGFANAGGGGIIFCQILVILVVV